MPHPEDDEAQWEALEPVGREIVPGDGAAAMSPAWYVERLATSELSRIRDSLRDYDDGPSRPLRGLEHWQIHRYAAVNHIYGVIFVLRKPFIVREIVLALDPASGIVFCAETGWWSLGEPIRPVLDLEGYLRPIAAETAAFRAALLR